MSNIEALIWEREGYVRRGLKDRVAAVDAELAALGHKRGKADAEVETASATPAPETASAKPRPIRKQG